MKAALLIAAIVLTAPSGGGRETPFAAGGVIRSQCEARWQNRTHDVAYDRREFTHSEYVRRCARDDLKQWQ